jgi:hypothetical protein
MSVRCDTPHALLPPQIVIPERSEGPLYLLRLLILLLLLLLLLAFAFALAFALALALAFAFAFAFAFLAVIPQGSASSFVLVFS